jgi:hypothetical protein
MPEPVDDLVVALHELGERLDLPARDSTDLVEVAIERIRSAEAAAAGPGTLAPGPRGLVGRLRRGHSASGLPAGRRRPARGTLAHPGAGAGGAGRRLVVVAAAVLLVVLVALAVPGPRHAVARWLGIGSVAVTYTGEVPGDAGATYDLGTPVPVARAVDEADWPVAAPADAGDPSAAFVGRPVGSITLVWAPSVDVPEVDDSGIGLVLSALPGTTDAGLVSKRVGPGTTVELVRVGDRAAYWIAGDPHELLVIDPDGRVVTDASRLAGNTLIWTDADITYRLESGLDRDAAVGMAESLRPLSR